MDQKTPIQYPAIEVPGKGTFVVKFGFGAIYTLEDRLGLAAEDIGAKLHEMFPTGGAPGKISPVFLTKVLSACIWDQAHLTPEEIAYCFEPSDLPTIGRVVAEAFAKTQWPTRAPTLQEPATKKNLEQPIQ
jgi:hypothetical protein